MKRGTKKVPEQLRSSPDAGAPVVYFWPGADIPDCLSRRPPIGSRDRFARSPCIDFNALAWRSAFSSGATLSKCWHRHGHHHRRHNQRHHDHRHEAPHKQHPFCSGAEEERCSQTPAPVNQRGQLTRPVKGGVIPNWTIFVCIVVRQWSWGIGTAQREGPEQSRLRKLRPF